MELTRQGLSNAEICRQLGIHRKTGSHWRDGRRGRSAGGGVRSYPALAQVLQPRVSARFFSEEERAGIADLIKAGHLVRHPAGILGRSPSTIGRELHRKRGTSENTNRLLRDYFPKRADLSIHTPRRFTNVAAELNDRPREVLNG